MPWMAWMALIPAFIVIGAFFLVSLFFLVLSPTLGGASQERGTGSFLLSILALPFILGWCIIQGGMLAYQGQPFDALWIVLGGIGGGGLLLLLGGWSFSR